jgi:anaphase-promoting complex subunit 4
MRYEVLDLDAAMIEDEEEDEDYQEGDEEDI